MTYALWVKIAATETKWVYRQLSQMSLTACGMLATSAIMIVVSLSACLVYLSVVSCAKFSRYLKLLITALLDVGVQYLSSSVA